MSSFIYMQGKENSRRFRHSPLPVKNYFRFNTILQRQRSKVLHKVKNTKKETLAYSLKKILLNVLQGRRKKQPTKKTTLQNPTKYNLVSILDIPGFQLAFLQVRSPREAQRLLVPDCHRNCRKPILQVWVAQLPSSPSALLPHSYTAE